jgi:hypothetical protein
MDSNTVSHLPLPAAHPGLLDVIDANRAKDSQVEAVGGGEETKKYDKMVSFVALLEKYGFLKRCDRKYVGARFLIQ